MVLKHGSSWETHLCVTGDRFHLRWPYPPDPTMNRSPMSPLTISCHCWHGDQSMLLSLCSFVLLTVGCEPICWLWVLNPSVDTGFRPHLLTLDSEPICWLWVLYPSANTGFWTHQLTLGSEPISWHWVLNPSADRRRLTVYMKGLFPDETVALNCLDLLQCFV